MLRILIVDDHAIVRRGLREILREHGASTLVGEASSSEEAWQQLQAGPWDVVILDITMPGQSGLQLLGRIKREHPRLPVLMLSMHSGTRYVLKSLEMGAAGYLSKESAPEELVVALDKVLAGQRYISRALLEEIDPDAPPGAAGDGGRSANAGAA